MKDLALPPSHQSRIRQSFCRSLRTYHHGAEVQAEIAADLAADLDAVQVKATHFETVFEFGCGTGHLTRALCARYSFETLLLNDLVPDCAQHVSDVEARFLPGPVESLTLPKDLSLIASASTIQWVTALPELLDHLARKLAPDGWLALSGFGSRQFQELATLGSTAGAPSYADAADLAAMLPEKMEIVSLIQSPKTLWFDTTTALLRHLRATGVNGQASSNWTRKSLSAFDAAYRERFEQDGRVRLTYDPVRLVARKRG